MIKIFKKKKILKVEIKFNVQLKQIVIKFLSTATSNNLKYLYVEHDFFPIFLSMFLPINLLFYYLKLHDIMFNIFK